MSCTLSLSLSRSISFPLSLPSPLPFRCAFINYVGFLMISALLLSRLLSPAPSTFSACSLFFRWQVHIFLSLPSRPCICSCSSFLSLSLSFKPSSTHTTFACFITQEKSKLSAASFASKREKTWKKKKTFLHLHVGLAAGNCRAVEGSSYRPKFEECCISFHIFLPQIFVAFFCP